MRFIESVRIAYYNLVLDYFKTSIFRGCLFFR